jgi:CRISPR-associated protein Cas1
LVFDIADLFKDAVVLPLAFEAGSEGWDNKKFRGVLINRCQKLNILDILFDLIKRAS